MERIVVIDFGGQYNQLIARRVRELGVYSELLPRDASESRIRGEGLSGIILTGGPDSVYDPEAKRCPGYIFEMGVPVLGICYGMQYIVHIFGGTIEAGHREYADTPIEMGDHPLLQGMDAGYVWMNHNDSVVKLPAGFAAIAKTAHCIAAYANDEKRLYGIQFHAEVAHTPKGILIFENFLRKICHCQCTYRPENLAEELIDQIRRQVGPHGRVLGALSGGVDSTVAAALVHRAIGERLSCVFVDHGLLRQNEAEEVTAFYREQLGLNLTAVDAKGRFLGKLAGVSEPEQKRKIIGTEFVRVFEEETRKLKTEEDWYLLQGTIYPDVIESGTDASANEPPQCGRFT